MQTTQDLKSVLERFPRAHAVHAPTPVEPLTNLSKLLGIQLSIKRDDCTGIAFGGNKVRQLEFYLGEAVARGADTILITGAVQSNFVRTAAAMAARLNMQCHVQLEERVANKSKHYHESGNVLLNKLFGATIHQFPEGEDESAADTSLEKIAADLREQGASTYNIHLSTSYPPIGGLGYVAAAIELVEQVQSIEQIEEIFVCSGSALTHTGLLVGLRALGVQTPVRGICVRRDAQQQTRRVRRRTLELIEMLGLSLQIADEDIRLYDGSLAPGYGQLNRDTHHALEQTARLEGLLLDPTYTAKGMAGVFQLAEEYEGKHVLFWHTGGQPALFAYIDQLAGSEAV